MLSGLPAGAEALQPRGPPEPPTWSPTDPRGRTAAAAAQQQLAMLDGSAVLAAHWWLIGCGNVTYTYVYIDHH